VSCSCRCEVGRSGAAARSRLEVSQEGDRKRRVRAGRTDHAQAAMTVIAVVFFGAVSGCTVLAENQGSVPTNAQRREWERNGGY
jgi:hypothetical protein